MKGKNITIVVLAILVVILAGFLYKAMDYMKDEKTTNREVVLNNLESRRSIRKFKSAQIKDEELDAVLRAGTYAPSGMNKQASVMVVVQDPATLEKISKMNAKVMGMDVESENFKDPFYGAPTVVVVFADTTVHTYIEDGSLVMGNLMNAAHAVGLGSCWIHRAREVFATPEGREMMHSWGLTDNYVGIGNCILGYTAGEYPTARPRKDNYIIKAK